MFQTIKQGHEYRIFIQTIVPLEEIKTYNHNIKFQDGPIKEAGVNGIQNEDLLQVLINRLEYFQTNDSGRYACQENEDTILLLRVALRQQVLRTSRRQQRGVEGTNKV
jgi:hypothetical protein